MAPNMKNKKQFTFTLTSGFSELDTNLDICITSCKKGFFSKKTSVFISEKILDRGQLYVASHFEKIANGILCTELKNTNPKNIRWFHYNSFHSPHNPDSIKNYSEVIPVIQKGQVVGANWIDLHFLPSAIDNI